MSQIIIFLVLTVLTILVLVWLLFLVSGRAIAGTDRANPSQIRQLKKAVLLLAVLIALTAILIIFSQLTASTPRIDSANSIAELTQVELNGRKQWISLRAGSEQTGAALWQGAQEGPKWERYAMNWRSWRSILWW